MLQTRHAQRSKGVQNGGGDNVGACCHVGHHSYLLCHRTFVVTLMLSAVPALAVAVHAWSIGMEICAFDSFIAVGMCVISAIIVTGAIVTTCNNQQITVNCIYEV